MLVCWSVGLLVCRSVGLLSPPRPPVLTTPPATALPFLCPSCIYLHTICFQKLLPPCLAPSAHVADHTAVAANQQQQNNRAFALPAAAHTTAQASARRWRACLFFGAACNRTCEQYCCSTFVRFKTPGLNNKALKNVGAILKWTGIGADARRR